MKIKILSLRKTGDKNIDNLEADYLRRFKKYATVELIDIKRRKILSHQMATHNELLKIQSKLSSHEYRILLTEKGCTLNTQEFTNLMKTIINKGYSAVSFIIGGPTGYPEKLDECVDKRIALSTMIFPHKIIRLLLIEALYRAFDIMKGGSYSK
jgi:23S rRNA (pseudouridine1915-N3)-methyltransferase